MRKRKKKNEMAVLVKSVDGVVVVSTADMWEGLGVTRHRALTDMIRKYENLFQNIRTFSFLKGESIGGRQSEYCYLNEEQATFLITMMKNTETIVQFKYRLSREFYRMKSEITRIQSVARNNRLNTEWIEKREVGKQFRRIGTDMIKKYVEYSFERGSSNAGRYYGNITRMSNKTIFDIQQRVSNLRDVCNTGQLVTLQMVDTVITRALEADMAADVPYKQIYQNVKSKVRQFAELFGKTEIPGDTLQIGF